MCVYRDDFGIEGFTLLHAHHVQLYYRTTVENVCLIRFFFFPFKDPSILSFVSYISLEETSSQFKRKVTANFDRFKNY